MGYSINGRNVYKKWYLVYGSVERDRSALTKQQCAQKKATPKGILQGDSWLVQLSPGSIIFVTWRFFLLTRGLWERKGIGQ